MSRPTLRSIGAWLALAAALVLALAPTVSRAMADPSLPQALCSVDGTKLAGSTEPAPAPANGDHLDACDLCVVAAGGITRQH